MTDTSKIRRYYSQFPEWDRLDTSEGRLEFELSIGHLESHLIPGTRILDLGGGPGRYTIALAERGFQVFLAELSPELVSIAIDKIERLESKENVEGVKVVSALDLSLFEDNSFDSVVCFGPFYHLIQLQERQTAAAEIHRILKDDGLLFCSYIPRLSGVTSVIWRAANMPDQVS
ncbi:MAG: methyltransferase domain-containing protein, partial [Proteobacteria bacterium]|nr:methyltransferase domain-containing protein [Pseudomonadota bacterium]